MSESVCVNCDTRRYTTTNGSRLLGSALLALLVLAVISGGSWAGGDLFDDDYSDHQHPFAGRPDYRLDSSLRFR